MHAETRHSHRALSALALLLAAAIPYPASAAPAPTVFTMVPSAGSKGCLPKAKAVVTIKSLGPVESMTVVATGLPPDTDFDLFNIPGTVDGETVAYADLAKAYEEMGDKDGAKDLLNEVLKEGDAAQQAQAQQMLAALG